MKLFILTISLLNIGFVPNINDIGVTGNGENNPPTLPSNRLFTPANEVVENPDNGETEIVDQEGENVPVIDPNDGHFIPDTNITDITDTLNSGDMDNDVPMLTNIYERLAQIDQDNDHINLTNIWNRQAEQQGLIQEYNTTKVRPTTYADIENSLRRIDIRLEQMQGYYVDENGSNTGRYGSIVDIVNAINGVSDSNASEDEFSFQNEANETNTAITEAMEEFTDKIVINVEDPMPPESSPAISGLFEFDLNGKDYYMNPFNGTYSQNLEQYAPPAIHDIFLWIKRVLIAVVLWIWLRHSFLMISELLKTLITASESNPVSTYSIFGINIGGFSLKLIKLGMWGAFISILFGPKIIGIIEADLPFNHPFGGDGILQGIENAFQQLADGYPFAETAVYWLFLVVPIVTIVTSYTTFQVQKFLALGLIVIYNRGQRTAS